jgi:hypothetical protein
VYRDDFGAFYEDVTRERTGLMSPPKPPAIPEIERIVPTAAPRAWPRGQAGYSLDALKKGVLGVKKHFPSGAPSVPTLRWTDTPSRSFWGFCRCSDRTITLNCVLNSPDIPLFVMEYLMFHEMLHADMPTAGHNRDFRARERSFTPSADAIRDAAKRGVAPGPNAGIQFWYVSADRFLGTFDRYYLFKEPGTTMDLG